MYFGDQPREAKIKHVQDLVHRLTQSVVPPGTAEAILTTFESFESFVESGKSFKDLEAEAASSAELPADIMEVVGSFGDFLANRGGALATNEVWVLMSFLFWTRHCMALTGKEAKAIKELKDEVQKATRNDVFRMNNQTKGALQGLIQVWVQEVS